MPVVDEEPIWRALREGWYATRDYWDSFNMPTKVVVLTLGIIALAKSLWVLEYVVGLGLVYATYRVARAVVLSQERRRQGHEPASPADTGPRQYRATAESPAGAASSREPYMQAAADRRAGAAPGDWREASQRHWKKKREKRQWKQQAAAALVVKSPQQRLTELAGSMIVAAAMGATMSIVVVLMRGETIEREQFAWLAMVSVLGSWSILIASKFWEGIHGEALLRHVAQLILGLGIGGIAYLAADALMLKFSATPMQSVLNVRGIGGRFFDVNGSPLLNAYLAYFGALFGLVGWWRQADPLRKTRLSIWSTVWSVLVAWMITHVWPFPQPWGLMVAAILSASVQLASPFVSPRDRVAGQTS